MGFLQTVPSHGLLHMFLRLGSFTCSFTWVLSLGFAVAGEHLRGAANGVPKCLVIIDAAHRPAMAPSIRRERPVCHPSERSIAPSQIADGGNPLSDSSATFSNRSSAAFAAVSIVI